MQTWTSPHPSPRRLDLSDMTPSRRRAVIAALSVCCLLFLSGLVTAGALWKLARQFPRAPFKQPSRLYAQPTVLTPGAPMTAAEIVAELGDEGYREAPAGEPGAPLRRGSYHRDGDRVEVHLRRFTVPGGDADETGEAGGVVVAADLKGGHVGRLTVGGKPAKSAVLEPALLASFYGPEVDERRPVTLDSLPEPVVQAVLAAEDDGFYTHPGISPSGIARALWVNARGGSLQQGGSTVTQQLVKNVYLSRKRTLRRKLKEAAIAVVLEVRYSKRQILEAYLNEIYWGRSGAANLIGLGAASRAYFGKDADELTLPEAATLAGMIRGPSEYSPLENPLKTIERRNWVLQRMAELRWVTPEQSQRAQAEPLITSTHAAPRPLAPYFTKQAAEEAKERFDLDELADEGYLLFSTVGWREQRQAENAVTRGLAGLEKGLEKRHRGDDPLQAALISIDPRDGAIRTWVGGRDYGTSQFDRVSQARRQAGSAFKPVIYAAAFREAVVTPASLLKDSPIVVRVGNDRWQPQNNDHGFRGWVTVRSALEQSLNIPTIRLALQVGLGRVIDLAHDMGIQDDLKARASLALGAFEISPYEMAQVYATLADGGLRPELHGLAAVLDRAGEEVLGDDLPAPRRVLPAQTAYLVTSILQGVVDHGTGAGVRSQGLRDTLAGKTGTTNDRRDSWFAGYAPERVTVVWVGYDDNSKTQLSGARAALPIWSRFMAAVRPARGYTGFAPPAGMQTVTLDPTTGQLATPYCPYKVTETLPDFQVPAEPCQRHLPGGNAYAEMSLNGTPIDPATGQPFANAGWDPYGQESAGGAADETFDETDVDAAELPTFEPAVPLPPVRVTYPPARTFPARPVQIDPADSTAAVTPPGGGSILIRPAREAKPEAEAPPEAPPPTEQPATEAPPQEAPVGVVPPPAENEATPPPP